MTCHAKVIMQLNRDGKCLTTNKNMVDLWVQVAGFSSAALGCQKWISFVSRACSIRMHNVKVGVADLRRLKKWL